MSSLGGGASAREKLLQLSVRYTDNNAANRIGLVGKALERFASALVLGKIGRGLESFGKAILDVSKNALTFAANFDNAMLLVQTQAQLSGKQFNSLVDATERLIGKYPQAAEDVARGLYDIFSSTDVGYKAALTMIDGFAKAATAGGTTIETVSRAAIAEMNAFRLSASDLNHVLDLQFTLNRKGAGTYEEITSAIAHMLPGSRAFSQSLETASGALAFMTRQGFTASQAAISVARAMDQLFKPTNAQNLRETLGVDVVDKASGQYKQLGDVIAEMAKKLQNMTKPEQAAALAEVFGAGEIRANRFFRSAIANQDKLNELIAAMGSDAVAGQLKKTFGIMERSPLVKMKEFQNRLHVIGLELANLVIPSLMKLLAPIYKVIDAFDSLSPKTKELYARMFLLAGVFSLFAGKLLKSYGNLLSVLSLLEIGNLNVVALTKNILLAVSGVGLLAAAAYLVYKNWNVVGPFFEKLWGRVLRAFRRTWDEIVAWWNANGKALEKAILGFAKAVGELLVAAFEALAPVLMAVLPVLGNILKTAVQIGTVIAKALTPVVKLLGGVLKVVAPLLIIFWAAFKGYMIITSVVSGIKGLYLAIVAFLQLLTEGGTAAAFSMFSTKLQAMELLAVKTSRGVAASSAFIATSFADGLGAAGVTFDKAANRYRAASGVFIARNEAVAASNAMLGSSSVATANKLGGIRNVLSNIVALPVVGNFIAITAVMLPLVAAFIDGQTAAKKFAKILERIPSDASSWEGVLNGVSDVRKALRDTAKVAEDYWDSIGGMAGEPESVWDAATGPIRGVGQALADVIWFMDSVNEKADATGKTIRERFQAAQAPLKAQLKLLGGLDETWMRTRGASILATIEQGNFALAIRQLGEEHDRVFKGFHKRNEVQNHDTERLMRATRRGQKAQREEYRATNRVMKETDDKMVRLGKDAARWIDKTYTMTVKTVGFEKAIAQVRALNLPSYTTTTVYAPGAAPGQRGNARGGIIAGQRGFITRGPTYLVGEGHYPTPAGPGGEAIIPLGVEGQRILAKVMQQAMESGVRSLTPANDKRDVHLHFHGMQKMDVKDAMAELDWKFKTKGW